MGEFDGGEIYETGLPDLNLRRIMGNAPPEKANIVGFAETSHDIFSTFAASEWITKRGREGDILLVEGVGRGVPVEHHYRSGDYQVPEEIPMVGWDDMPAHRVAKTYARSAEIVAMRLDAAISRGESEEFVQALEVQLETSQADLKAAALRRNPSLRQAIRDVQSPDHTTYVAAGEAHFTDDPELIEQLEETTYTVLRPEVGEYSRRIYEAGRWDEIAGDEFTT